MIAGALHQLATMWTYRRTGYGGMEFAPPVLLRVRWQERQRLVRTKEGEERVSEATVYADAEIPWNARLALGDYRDVADPTDPASEVRTWEPMARERMTDLAGRTVGWVVYL